MKVLKPQSFPGFAIAWLDIVSNSTFIKYFLGWNNNNNTSNKDSIHHNTLLKYEKYLKLLTDLLAYIKPIGSEIIKDYNSKLFMDCLLRLFFYLTNSYPEFISSYYLMFIVALPQSQLDGFIQFKNIILSANPTNTTNSPIYAENSLFYEALFKDDNYNIEKSKNYLTIPKQLFDSSNKLTELNLKQLIDDSLLKKESFKYIEELINRLNHKENYNHVNYLVSYVGLNIKNWLTSNKISFADLTDFFLRILRTKEGDFRNFLIHSILNEIRWINSTTYYFSKLILALLIECKVNSIEEHILRNICMRLMVKPHPQGLVYLIREIFKHQKYLVLNRKIVKDNSNFDKILDEMYRFVQESSLDNYV